MSYVRPEPSAVGMGASWIGDLISGVASLTGTIVGAASASAISKRETALARAQIAAERDAASEAREYAFNEAQLQMSVRMAEIDVQREELDILREQAEEAAALREQGAGAPTVIVGASSGSGASPTVWIVGGVAGLLGLGLVVGGIYFVAKKKD